MSADPDQVTPNEGGFADVPPGQASEEGSGASSPAEPIESYGEEGPEEMKAEIRYLQQKLEDVQGESSLLKEWGARIAMYVDCLVDALETNQITHVYDVDGSLVSLDECRQKAKTLPHTRKPHCDDDLRTKQYEAEIDNLRQEIADLNTSIEETLQRSVEQDYLIEQLQTAEYQANCRWEAYYENAMRQWSKCYENLQGQYNDAVIRLQNLNTAYNSLKKTAAGRNQLGPFNRPDPFRRHRPAAVRRDVGSAGPGQHQQRRPPAASGERMTRSAYQGRDYWGRNDFGPVLPRAERAAILKQFFANLNMIRRRQEEMAGVRWLNRRHEPRRRQRPGPYGEAN
ncbi:uncharacterized protein LOC110974140 [Acanthaster planci]|uniref:Uncharacterized protein LOC110974140 n=1 Tax=Acanthaster planci TaxID=133434 RepID=A0A8B7XK86_ACAPL|nr:uncharacterized protein LOC110974140 [Acanthaster planci]